MEWIKNNAHLLCEYSSYGAINFNSALKKCCSGLRKHNEAEIIPIITKTVDWLFVNFNSQYLSVSHYVFSQTRQDLIDLVYFQRSI
jgi:hypothetical protein